MGRATPRGRAQKASVVVQTEAGGGIREAVLTALLYSHQHTLKGNIKNGGKAKPQPQGMHDVWEGFELLIRIQDFGCRGELTKNQMRPYAGCKTTVCKAV